MRNKPQSEVVSKEGTLYRSDVWQMPAINFAATPTTAQVCSAPHLSSGHELSAVAG
jgi:hypothetical protein